MSAATITDLCQPFGGVLAPPEHLPMTQLVERTLSVCCCPAGCIGPLFKGAIYHNGKFPFGWWGLIGGACDADPETAEFKSVCEAAERYANSVALRDEWIVSSARELGSRAFDWTRMPRLSNEELALPGQVFANLDPDRPIRWIKAVELGANQTRLIPLVAVQLYPRPWSSERFWSPITTGTAVHSDPVQAVVSAIYETIERDGIALTWLLRRRIPRITFADAELALLPSWAQGIVRSGEVTLFDATTDLGVPSVYALRRRPGHPKAANVVACACGLDFDDLVLKAVREIMMISTSVDRREGPIPADPLDCISIDDGARYMARPEMDAAFAFFHEGPQVSLTASKAKYQTLAGLSARLQLRWLVRRLREKQQPVYVSEVTVDEIREVGLRAFHAFMPGLMPMSCVYRCRFLGSDRLRDFHQANGGSTPLEDVVNPNPQPFA